MHARPPQRTWCFTLGISDGVRYGGEMLAAIHSSVSLRQFVARVSLAADAVEQPSGTIQPSKAWLSRRVVNPGAA